MGNWTLSLPTPPHAAAAAAEVTAPSTVCTVERSFFFFHPVQENNQTACAEESGGHNGDGARRSHTHNTHTDSAVLVWDVRVSRSGGRVHIRTRLRAATSGFSRSSSGVSKRRRGGGWFTAFSENNVSFFEYLRSDDNFPLFPDFGRLNRGR